MKVLVIGANGQIGKHLIRLLKDSQEHEPRAMVRKGEQAEAFRSEGIEATVADLEAGVEELAEAATGCDAIVFTAGSGGHTGADKTLLVDLDGAGKSIEAAEKAGIDRFVMVSAIHADKRESWSPAIRPYLAAKHYADRILMQSRLKYTIVRPGRLVNEEGTGKISVGDYLERGAIPREDVAKTIVAALGEERTIKRSFDLISGGSEIADALQQL